MTATLDYSVTHRAILRTASRHGLTPIEVRVLVALRDRGSSAYADELGVDLHVEGSAVRRSVSVLRPDWLTGGDKRGKRLPIELTTRGRKAVDEFDRWRTALQGEHDD